MNKPTLFVYGPYLKDLKLGYWFIALILVYRLISKNVANLECKQKLSGFP